MLNKCTSTFICLGSFRYVCKEPDWDIARPSNLSFVIPTTNQLYRPSLSSPEAISRQLQRSLGAPCAKGESAPQIRTTPLRQIQDCTTAVKCRNLDFIFTLQKSCSSSDEWSRSLMVNQHASAACDSWRTERPEFLQRKGLVVPSGMAQTSLSQPAPLNIMDHSALNHSQRKAERIDAYSMYLHVCKWLYMSDVCVLCNIRVTQKLNDYTTSKQRAGLEHTDVQYNSANNCILLYTQMLGLAEGSIKLTGLT